MTFDVEHLLICISSSVKFLFWSFAYFIMDCLNFLLLSFESSSYILDTNPMLNIWLTNILYHL